MITTENKNTKFKYSLEKIYEEVNRIVRILQTEELTGSQRDFLIGDLLEITEELVQGNCRRFIARFNIKEITQEELYAIAIALPLMEALKWFSFEKGNNFMPMWEMFMTKRFYNALKEISTEKASFFRNNISSSDKPLDANGTTISEMVGEEDFTEDLCAEMVLEEIINEFEETDKHGKIIRCLLIGSQNLKTEAIMEILGAETYGSKERKQVQRVKERFAKHLIHKGYDVSKFI